MAKRPQQPKGPDWSPEKTLPLLKEQLLALDQFKGKRFQEVDRAENEWEEFTRSVIIHGFGDDSQNLSNFYGARSAGIHSMMGISDQQRQLNFQERISRYESTLKSSIRELEATIRVQQEPFPLVPVPLAAPARPRGRPVSVNGDQPLVLISHSSKDVELASALVEFLRAGLLTNRIRCSSVDGFRLPAGVDTDSQLRAEVNTTDVVIGLITPNSLVSAYVMFELGARWGAGGFMIPLLAGITSDDVHGPLRGLNALQATSESQLHQLLTDVANPLGIAVQNPASYVGQLSTVRTMAMNVGPTTRESAAVAAPAERSRELRLSLTVEGTPPSQVLKTQANQHVRAVRLEYLLSTGVCLATDTVNLEGESFFIPINDQHVLKLWNTPRADRNDFDHSGPAKLRLILSVADGEIAKTLPIHMESYIRNSTHYRKLLGSETF
jgi:hypothetical protein